MSEIGQLVKKLRGKESLRDASKKIGISHTYLDTIEKGYDKRSGKHVNPSPDTLRLISKAYNYPYKKLLQLAGYVDNDDINSNEPDSIVEIQGFIKELGIDEVGFFDIDQWRNLSPEDIEEIKRHFEWIAHKAKERNKNK